MSRIWAVALFSIRDALRRKVWYPFFATTLLGILLMIVQFGSTLSWQNPYADNIISSFFWFWAWGTLATGMILGATSLPVERQSRVLLALPMARWQLILGKLIGVQILLSGFILTGYGISLMIAARQHLEVLPYSRLGLVTALSSSFICLCLSIPLGARLSAPAAGTLAVFLLVTPPFVDAMAMTGAVSSGIARVTRYVLPFSVPTHPMNNAFWENIVESGQYGALAWSVFFSFALFSVLVTLINRSELSAKS